MTENKQIIEALQTLISFALKKDIPEINDTDIKISDDKICFNICKIREQLGMGIDDFKQKLLNSLLIYSYKPETKKETPKVENKKEDDVTIDGYTTVGYLYEHFEQCREFLETAYKTNKNYKLYPGYTRVTLDSGEECIMMRPLIEGPVGLISIGVIKSEKENLPYVAKSYKFPKDYNTDEFYTTKCKVNNVFSTR